MTLNVGLLQILRYLGNGGIGSRYIADSQSGNFEIQNNRIALGDNFKKGHWIAIKGSDFSDGVYKVVDDLFKLGNGTDDKLVLEDEIFTGTIYRLRLPTDLVALAQEFVDWHNNPANKPSLLQSHSVVGQYSEVRATTGGGMGEPLTWFSLHKKKLPPRQPFNDVAI